jgi:hypothetical protein
LSALPAKTWSVLLRIITLPSNGALFEPLLNWVVAQGVVDLNSDLHTKALASQNLLIGLNAMCKVITKENYL